MKKTKSKKQSDWQTVYVGNLFYFEQNEKGWERAIRAPGVRIIIDDKQNQKILLTREFRHELNDYDWRLAGGKVFDSLAEYQQFLATDQDVIVPAKQKVVQEALEETGYNVGDVEFLTKSTLGVTVKWDLLYFTVGEFNKDDSGQQLEDGEMIETDHWFSYQEVEQMIINGSMHEERSAFILLRYLRNKN